jgi:hypothetical protein
VLDRVRQRLDREPERMQIRRETAEHSFGTIKSWMGSTHFQMKTLKHVSTEMSLHMVDYNLKRAISLFGVKGHAEDADGLTRAVVRPSPHQSVSRR